MKFHNPTFTVDDFKSKNRLEARSSYKDEAKNYVYSLLVQRHHAGDWNCAYQTWEKNNRKLTTTGMTEIVRDCLDKQNLAVYAALNYEGDTEKTISYIVKKLSQQYSKRFADIYKFNVGRAPDVKTTIDVGYSTKLDQTFKTASTKKTINSVSNSEIFQASSEISKILEKFEYEDQQKIFDVLNKYN